MKYIKVFVLSIIFVLILVSLNKEDNQECTISFTKIIKGESYHNKFQIKYLKNNFYNSLDKKDYRFFVIFGVGYHVPGIEISKSFNLLKKHGKFLVCTDDTKIFKGKEKIKEEEIYQYMTLYNKMLIKFLVNK